MSLMFINLIYVALLRLTDSFVYRLGENCNIKWHGIDSQGKSRDLFVMWNNESCGIMNLLRLQILNLALRLLCLILIVTHIWRYGNHLPESRMIGNGVGKKNKKFLFFISKKKRMRVIIYYFGY